jgi:hypothetical protein
MFNIKQVVITIIGGVSLAIMLSTHLVADDKVTVGDVKFESKITGSDNDGFSISASNRGKTDRKCKVSITLTKKNGSKQTWDYNYLASARDVTEFVAGEASISGAPLSNPDLKASCE